MDRIAVIKSKIEGKGVAAKIRFKRGDFVGYIKGPIKHKVNKSDVDSRSHPDWVGFKKNYWIDPLPPFKYLNHSCDPNCGIMGMKRLTAMRDIEIGEEITFDYSTTEIDQNWELPYTCRCGALNCRKIIRSFQTLDKSILKKYLPYIPTQYKKLI